MKTGGEGGLILFSCLVGGLGRLDGRSPVQTPSGWLVELLADFVGQAFPQAGMGFD